MKKILTTSVAALLVQAAAVTPAAAQSRAERQLMADIRMLQEQTQQLAITLSALQDALKALNGRLDDTNTAARKGFADQKLIIDNMGSDLRVIRERVDETNVRVSTVSQEMEALRSSVTQLATAQLPAAAPSADAPADPNAPAGSAAPPPAPALPATLGMSPTRAYEQAWADYTAGQWTLAITGFETFLKTFPKSEMADEAQFYIGETYANTGKWADAVNAYNRVTQSYPTSNSTPLAFYKRGLAQERLDQFDAARASYEHVIKNYPDSDAAGLARQSLERVLARKPGA